MSPLNRYAGLPIRQRGAISLLAALTLGFALLCTLLVIDSGRLYLEKRSLQRIADMAALEAAGRKGTCSPGSSASTFANQSSTRNSFVAGTDSRTLTINCGTLTLDADSRRTFTADATKSEAIRVVATHAVPRSIAAGIAALFDSTPTPPNIQLSATAVAAGTPPLAALTIRSAAMTIDSTKAALLNPVIGSLLGGTLNLSVANWQGIASTDLSVLNYLDRLKTDLNINAVGYTDVLNSNVAVSQLIQTAINVLDPAGTLSATATIAGLRALKVAAGATTVLLGDLLSVQGSTNIAALNTSLRLIDLVQGLAQLANDKNGVSAAAQINLAGLAQVTTRIQVVEPPQLSAVGDPSKIDPLNPKTGANRLYVRTAQMRALVSINLPVLGAITPLVNTATSLVSSLTPVLNSALSLNLAGLLGSTTCAIGLTSCMVSDIKLLTSSSSSSAGPRIDLSISLASADTYVTGYTCTSNTSKTLSIHTDTALLSTRIGLIDSAGAFPASTDPSAITALPIPVIDIGTQTCQKILGLLGSCTARVPFGGGGVGISFDPVNQSPLGGSSSSTNSSFSSPNLPEVSSAPHFPADPAAAVLPSALLDGVISSARVSVYRPSTTSPNGLGNVITGAASLLGAITTSLDGIVASTLRPLLTSVVDPLIDALGLTLSPAEVGGNLSCNFGQATLVI
ncbi:TadG family pilus assembly protein [Pseudomonas capsici]|uniref:TadG family pilus assembly protein n=1 Tax=Pseudomonas capsici TaxID=2810614 RepID=UPI0021F0D1EE|nr:TadG family pilus assembly protein [Pseudomonas capsici]MCV4265415.1 pilus assembly protein TadG-related protein [Pseudomonas capsici]